MAKKRILNIGDEFYLRGKGTKVKIIKYPNRDKPICKILIIGPYSKYSVGQHIGISRRILWSYQGYFAKTTPETYQYGGPKISVKHKKK